MGEVCILRLGVDKTRQAINCPVCRRHVKPVKYGLNNCQYRYISIKETKEISCTLKSKWQEINDTYHIFDENICVSYPKLLIEVKKHGKSDTDSIQQTMSLTQHIECSICLVISIKVVEEESIFKFEGCEHIFHKKCLIQWFNLSSFCPLCNTYLS